MVVSRKVGSGRHDIGSSAQIWSSIEQRELVIDRGEHGLEKQDGENAGAGKKVGYGLPHSSQSVTIGNRSG